MPNWCLNKLTVSHNDPAMFDRFVKAYNAGKACSEFLPIPEGYLEDGRWYDWCVANWQTKWDVGADEGTEKEERYGLKATVVGNEANCSFDSAWSPPVGLYNELVRLGYDVHASYFEPGMSFCGIFHNGYDDYIEYESKNDIPISIIHEYGLEDFFETETA